MTGTRAEISVPTRDLRADIAFFTRDLAMRLEQIWPADNPAVAVVAGHGMRLRLEAGLDAPPARITLHTDRPEAFTGPDGRDANILTAPGGARVALEPLAPVLILPVPEPVFAVRRLADQAPWVIGRAGMHYRDLVPSRLGGAIIASHIRIPDGGPVPDMVHYHTVGFQLIFCYRGWVDLVYEDQGPPFRLFAGNCVIQPPEIRHRVLYASDEIEVIEIGVPAEHVTTIDHEMTLPTPVARPEREFQGQRFVHHRAEEAEWRPFRLPGYVSRDTRIALNTNGVAGVHVVRRGQGAPAWTRHDADILFGFVMAGEAVLDGAGQGAQALSAGDAFTIPPGLATRLSGASEDFELLEVTLPGQPTTEIVADAAALQGA